MPDYEITTLGFDGGTDATDDRVLWVTAPDLSTLRDTLRDAPYQNLSELPNTSDYSDAADFTLPRDALLLCDKLNWFASHPPCANQTCSECGAKVNEIIGCPDGAEICRACFDAGKH